MPSGCGETAATGKVLEVYSNSGGGGPFLSQKSVSKTDLFDKDF